MNDGNITRAELERLQMEQAYQADTIGALNDALAAQQIELIEVRQTLRLLEARLRELRDAAAGDSDAARSTPEPPPPHY